MFPSRARGQQRRNNTFSGAPLQLSSSGTYGRALLSPATPSTIAGFVNLGLGSQTVQWTGRNNLSMDEMKRACGLPEPIADFILNISAIDLTEAAAEDSNNEQALQPTTNPSPPKLGKTHLLAFPSLLRPRAIVDQEPEPITPSASTTLAVWYEKTELPSLPPEIRQLIFSFLLAPSASTTTTVPADSTNPRAPQLAVPVTTAADLSSQAARLRGAKSLLLVSKQFRREFLPPFAARYAYKVTTPAQLLWLGLPSRPLSLSGLSLHWQHLQHVELATSAHDAGSVRAVKAFLQLCSLAIYLLPKLRSLAVVQLPAAFSPVRFYVKGTDDEGRAASLDVFRCDRLVQYGERSWDDGAQAAVAADDFAADVLGMGLSSGGVGWGVGLFRIGAMLQEWMAGEGVEEFDLFGGVYRAGGGKSVALVVTLVTEGNWRRERARE
jgi:hypothetical protein